MVWYRNMWQAITYTNFGQNCHLGLIVSDKIFIKFVCYFVLMGMQCRVDSRLVPIQWETSLQSNAVSHWLSTNLESSLQWGIYLSCVFRKKTSSVSPSDFNSLDFGISCCNLKLNIFKLISRINTLGISCEITLGWCCKTSLMISQHWFR